MSFGRAFGDESLLTPLRSLEAGGCERSELNTIGVLGRTVGIGAKASSLTDTENHLNDATVTVVPIRPMETDVASDSVLKLRKTKSKAGFQGPELATTEKLEILGARVATLLAHRARQRKVLGFESSSWRSGPTLHRLLRRRGSAEDQPRQIAREA